MRENTNIQIVEIPDDEDIADLDEQLAATTARLSTGEILIRSITRGDSLNLGVI